MTEDREYYDIAKAFAAIEAELLDSMMRNMHRHKLEENVEGKEWAQWQAVMLAELNEYKKKNRVKFKKDFEYINQMFEEAIIQARKDGNMDQEAEILEAIQNGYGYHRYGEAVNGSFFRVNDRKMDALIKATTNDMKQAETAMLRKANDDFRKVIYHSQVYMASGAATYEKAVDMAANDFLMRGIQCVKYKGGSMHNIKDYADMVLRTTTKRAYLTGEGEMRQSWGISLVILNKRTNACPKCTPFVGKVLIDDVWSGGKPDGKHRLMSEAIRQGLYHPRCKDAHTTYFGSNKTKPYTKEERQKLEDDYKEEQKERAKQRQIEGLERVEKHALSPDTRKLAKRKREILEKNIVKTDENDIINTKINESDKVVNPMDRDIYERMKKGLENNGIKVIKASGDDLRYLKAIGAEASYGHGYIMHIDEIPSASAMYEEVIHATQSKIYGEFLDSNEIELTAREIAANRMLLKNADIYGFDDIDKEDIKRNLTIWEQRFKKVTGESYGSDRYNREI